MQQDEELQALISKPLFLAIVALAYQNRSADELVGLTEKARLQIVFDRYVDQMFVQREMGKKERGQMTRWLSVVAWSMGSGKEFLIERIQPGGRVWQYQLVFGLTIAIIYGSIGGLIAEPVFGLLIGLIYGLINGLWKYDSIDLVEAIQISKLYKAPEKIIYSAVFHIVNIRLFGLIFGLVSGLIIGLKGGWVLGLVSVLPMGLSHTLIFGLTYGLFDALTVDIQTRPNPNQGVWNSVRTMLIATVIALVFFLLIHRILIQVLPVIGSTTLTMQVINGVSVLPLIATFEGSGGEACVQHFVLRVVLYSAKVIPWNFVTFFQQAEDRLFIQRTGGSYIFLHRYLQEYFADSSE